MILNSDFQEGFINPYLYPIDKEQVRLYFAKVCDSYINITSHDPSTKDIEYKEEELLFYIMNFVNFIRVNYPNDLILLIDCLFEALDKAVADPNYEKLRRDEEIAFLLARLKLQEISERHFNILFKVFDAYNLRIALTLNNIVSFPIIVQSAMEILLALDERLFTNEVQQKITDIILKWSSAFYNKDFFSDKVRLLKKLVQLISPDYYSVIVQKMLEKIGELNSNSLDEKKVCLLLVADGAFNSEQIKNIDFVLKDFWIKATSENLEPYYHLMEERSGVDAKPYISIFGKERALQYLFENVDINDEEAISENLQDEIKLVAKNISDVAILDLTGICRFLADANLLNQENLKTLNQHSSNINGIRISLQDASYRRKLDQQNFNTIMKKYEDNFSDEKSESGFLKGPSLSR